MVVNLIRGFDRQAGQAVAYFVDPNGTLTSLPVIAQAESRADHNVVPLKMNKIVIQVNMICKRVTDLLETRK